MRVRTQSKAEARGFTLIELLVVIAIIALLAAILFPVFARARENARRSSCQSNVKQILLGITQYNQDYDEIMPISFGGGGTDALQWTQRIFVYVKTPQLFQCPSDSSKAAIPWGTNANPAYPAPFHSSYGANYRIIGGGGYGSGSSSALSDIAQPSSTVLISDLGTNCLTAAPWYDANVKKNGTWILVDPKCNSGVAASPYPAIVGDPAQATSAGNGHWAAPSLRHLEMGNVGYVDGHVKSQKPEAWYWDNTPWLDPARGG